MSESTISLAPGGGNNKAGGPRAARLGLNKLNALEPAEPVRRSENPASSSISILKARSPRFGGAPHHWTISRRGESTALPSRPPRKKPRQRPPLVDRSSGSIEVEIEGVTVRIGRGVDAKTIAAVLRALKAGA